MSCLKVCNAARIKRISGNITFAVVTLLTLCVIAATARRADAQAPQRSDPTIGFALTLTNSGFGFGGYARDSLTTQWAMMLEASLASGKDEREVAFLNRFGQKSIPGKANYLLVAPFRLGVQRRVFADQIEDNFRPFYQLSAGPTLAWEYPYFADCNGDGRFDVQVDCNGDEIVAEGEGDERLSTYRALSRGRMLMGLGGALTLGAYFGRGSNGARGFRIGYAFNYYPTGTALLEVDSDDPRHYFGTPFVTVYFGRLF